MNDGEILTLILKDKNITTSDFCTLMDRRQSTVYGWLNSRFIKSESVDQICKKLGLERWEFYIYPERDKLHEYLPPWITKEQSEFLKTLDSLDNELQASIWQLFGQLIKMIKKPK